MNDKKEKKSAPVISAYIITRNEEENIGRALESIKWMDEIIILDSGSTDKTLEIAGKYGAKVYFSDFDGFAEQKNKAMGFCSGEWLFNIDADEEVTESLRKSIEFIIFDKSASEKTEMYKVCRKTFYLGKWIKHCGWYPEYRARLSKKGSAVWTGEILHENLTCDGLTEIVSGDLLHRPYKNIAAHLKKIDRYTGLWAERESGKKRKPHLYDIVFRPVYKFFRMYVFKAGFLDGGPGIIVSFMGGIYTFLKYARLYEISRNNK